MSQIQSENEKIREESEVGVRKLRRSETDCKILTGQAEQLKSEFKKQEHTKKRVLDELQQSEHIRKR
jgi:ribosomal protein S15P/S13E